MNIVPTSARAARMALEVAFGTEGADIVAKLYDALAAIEKEGYQHGFDLGFAAADENTEAEVKTAYDEGFSEGYEVGHGIATATMAEQPVDASYEYWDGYLDLWDKEYGGAVDLPPMQQQRDALR